MADDFALFLRLLGAHLELVLYALAVGIGLSVPLGVLASRRRGLGNVALNVASVAQTVPSLALLALMVPLLGALRLTSIGFLPAFIALVVYSVLPILSNTVAALHGIEPSLTEAARAVGMRPHESLLRVELPLALPVIVAGIRTATVWTVGAATLATPVGASSLGNYIFSGLQTRNVQSLLTGCLGAAGLALLLDGLMRVLSVAAARRSRKLAWLGAGAFAALFVCAVLSSAGRFAPSRAGERVVVGAKTFTEQYVLAEALAAYVERSAAVSAEVKSSLGSSVVFDALRDGSVDLYVDYSGTLWATVLKRTDEPPERAAMLAELGRSLEQEHGVVLVCALGFENAYALAMRRAHAAEIGARSIGDLVPQAGGLTVGGDYEFFGRPEWKAIQERYGVRFKDQRAMDPSLMYEAVATGGVDVISSYSTDGRIVAFDLVVLEDDRRAMPPYDAVLLASRRLVERHPEILLALRALAGSVDAERMRRLNLAVDRDRRSPKAVARELAAAWERGRPAR